jgi:predicted RNase H-like nuclease
MARRMMGTSIAVRRQARHRGRIPTFRNDPDPSFGRVSSLAGVDGCRAGWVVARADRALRGLDFAVYPTFAAVLAAHPPARTVLAVDIPIGLPGPGPRACDAQARALLGRGRASSVFPAPSRAALGADGYRSASAANRAATGRGLSRQSYGILARIREVDAVLTPALQARVREAHPEVVFCLLGGAPLASKTTPAGEAGRLALLRTVLPPVDPAAVRARLEPAGVGRDDVVDALACLVAAWRLATGAALVLPRGAEERDERGLRAEIVA